MVNLHPASPSISIAICVSSLHHRAPLLFVIYFHKMCLYFCSVSTMDQAFFCYVCIAYVWLWSSAPFVSELCVRRTSDESRHSRAINAMYHSLRSKNRHQDVMSCHWKQFQLCSGLIFLHFVFRKRDLLDKSFCWNNLNKGRNIHSKYFQQIIKEPDIGICSLKATQLLLKRKKLIWCCLAEIGGGHDLPGQERLQPPSPSCPVYPDCTQPLCT